MVINKRQYIVRETENYIAYGNVLNENVEIELKPNCDPQVKKMWEQLHEPIRRNGYEK